MTTTNLSTVVGTQTTTTLMSPGSTLPRLDDVSAAELHREAGSAVEDALQHSSVHAVNVSNVQRLQQLARPQHCPDTVCGNASAPLQVERQEPKCSLGQAREPRIGDSRAVRNVYVLQPQRAGSQRKNVVVHSFDVGQSQALQTTAALNGAANAITSYSYTSTERKALQLRKLLCQEIDSGICHVDC